MERKIELGQPCHDSATSFHGIATARCEHYGGEVQLKIERVDKDGKPLSEWFSEGRCRPGHPPVLA